MIGRLVQAADFKRLLSVPPVFKSAHFAVHHLVEVPKRPAFARKVADGAKLSTAHEPVCPQPVDESRGNPQEGSPQEGFPRWLGCVVPKRHARRAVTRNLLKRQIYAAAGRAHAGLPGGMWLVRLRQPFAVSTFPSAASQALRETVRGELDRLFQKASHRTDAVVRAAP